MLWLTLLFQRQSFSDMDGCHFFLMMEVLHLLSPDRFHFKNKLRWMAEFVKVQERGVFKGGSLFPSPFFVTSTQIDCDNSYPIIWSVGFICKRRGPLKGAQLSRWNGVPGTSPSSAM